MGSTKHDFVEKINALKRSSLMNHFFLFFHKLFIGSRVVKKDMVAIYVPLQSTDFFLKVSLCNGLITNNKSNSNTVVATVTTFLKCFVSTLP